MKIYKQRVEEIKALQFRYSTEGIDELRELCGDKLVSVSKNRNPGAIGQAIILINNTEVVVLEGMYVCADFKVYPEPIFNKIFEEVKTAKVVSLSEYLV